MRNVLSILAAGVAGMLLAGVIGFQPFGTAPAPAPEPAAAPGFAAVPGELGGQDPFGPYEPVDWPKDLATLPGHEGWTFGSGSSVFAESPDRIFVLQRGELPDLPRPMARKLGTSLVFPIGRLPWRDATAASPPANGGTTQPAEPGIENWLKAGNQFGVDARWEHTLKIFDGEGNVLDAWTQYDKMFQRPHQIAISPYDPQKHVWVVEDHKHAIFKITNDGKQIVQTIGTYGVLGDDETHFNRPTFMDWFPDGSFVVADGYNGARVGKFDAAGKYLTSWGQRGEAGKETRPGYMNNVHGIAVDPKTRQVFVNDRANRRIQVFDENGQYLREWSVGRLPADVHTIHIYDDGYLWAADRGTNKMVKYDLEGNFQYSWGVWGDFPGGMWGVHDFTVDSDGNVYVAEVDNGGAQKYRPRQGANPAFMLGKPLRPAGQ